jgi:hypothetical protein
VLTTRFELEPGSHDQILHGAREQHLARTGYRGHPGADVQGHAGQVLAPDLTHAVDGAIEGGEDRGLVGSLTFGFP